MPVAATITAGEASDYSGFDPLIDAEGPEPKVLLADRGYDSDHIRETMEARGAATVIPTRKNRKTQIPVDATLELPQSHGIEPEGHRAFANA